MIKVDQNYSLQNLTSIIMLLLLISCAKDFKNTEDNNQGRDDFRNDRRVTQSIKDFILTQEIECTDEIICNSSIAKIIVFDRARLRYCTASLVADDVLLTSASCLNSNMRFPKVACHNDLVAVFPGNSLHQEYRAFCDEIIQANTIKDNVDMALKKSDFAFIKLKNKVPRRPMVISRSGIESDKEHILWKSSVEDTYRSSLEPDSCIPLLESYANPFTLDQFSPMVTVKNCAYQEGNRGAPLLNIKGEIVGILSGKINNNVRDYISSLLIDELDSISYISNIHCIKTPFNKNDNIEFDDQCSQEINIGNLDHSRARLLGNIQIHNEHMSSLIEELNQNNNYFDWRFSFRRIFNGLELELDMIRPKCIKNINSWISEFTRRRRVQATATKDITVPNYIISTRLTSDLKAVSIVEESGEKTFTINFSPSQAFFENSTRVEVQRDLFGSNRTSVYESITSDCE